jgi:hypothetical protein
MVIEAYPSLCLLVALILVIQSVATIPILYVALLAAAVDNYGMVSWFIMLVLEGLWIGAFVVYNGDPQLRALGLAAEQSWANTTLTGNKMMRRNMIPEMVDGTLIGIKYGPVFGMWNYESFDCVWPPFLLVWQHTDLRDLLGYLLFWV